MRNAIRLPIWISLSAALVVFLAAVAVSCGGSSPTSTPPPTERPTSPLATATSVAVPTSTAEHSPTEVPPTATARPTDTSAAPEPTPEMEAADQEIGQIEGVTFVIGEGSLATFTVEEKLARLPLPNDAVVSTKGLTGEVHFDGRPSVIEIDLHQLQSDQPRRDQYIRERMFPNHSIAVFTLDDVGPLPDGFTEGQEVTTQITGQLDIRGVQAPVSFDVEARDDGDVIYILGRTSFVWEEFGMTAPNLGFVVVTDEVSVEVLLSVTPKS